MQIKRAGRAFGLAGLCAVLALSQSCGGGSLSINIDTPTTPTRADGQTPALINITVKQGKDPVPDANQGSVQISTDIGEFQAMDPGSQEDPSSQSVTQSLASGSTRVQLFSLRSGTANITVTYTDQYGTTATKKGTVLFGSSGGGATVASIQYVGANPATINLAGSGGVTTTEVTFKILDSSGSPVADGVSVSFQLSQNPGGASISPTTAATSQGQGTVQTILSAGSIPGTVVIQATAGTVTTQSQPIAIAGGGVNFKNFSLACDHYSIAGFAFFGLNNTCTVFASDVNGQFVQGTQVQVMSEAGSVPQTVQVSQAGDGSDHGEAQFNYQTDCPIPKDVSPNSGEYQKTIDASDPHAFVDSCHVSGGVVAPAAVTRTVNPRDGDASLVVYTLGEECYNDLNRNGRFDPGEEDLANCDLGEPFLDENDNGKYDGPGVDSMIPEGEPFFDYDGNGVWTPPNGKWDAQWPIWRSVVITWTGQPGPLGSGLFFNVTQAPPSVINHCTNSSIEYEWYDVNGNCPTSDGVGDNVSLDCGNTNCTVPSTESPLPDTDCSAFHTDSNGLPALKQDFMDGHDCSAACDANAPFPDGGGTVCPTAAPYQLGLTITRTLASDTSSIGDQGVEIDTFGNIASGTYK